MGRLLGSSSEGNENTGRGHGHALGKRRFVAVAVPVCVLLGALGVGAIPSGAAGQEVGDEAGAPSIESQIRVVARRIADGRTEFGVQLRRVGGEWGERVLPERRYFPAEVAEDRWLRSSPVSVAEWIRTGTGVREVRVVARRLSDGRTEFGLRFRGEDGVWSGTRLPQRRFFPAEAAVDRWLVSSPLRITPAGSGSEAPAATPADEAPRDDRDPERFTQLSVAQGRTCAVRADGTVSCWGRYELQEWLSTIHLAGVETVGIAGDHNSRLHRCALHVDASVSCWGLNYYGRLGQGEDRRAHYLPAKVPGIDDAVALAVGNYHTCVVHSDGGVSCWGYNADGQMGTGSVQHVRSPQRVPGLENVVGIASSPFAVCAVHRDGGISCWGWLIGRLPQRVSGLSGAAVSVEMSGDRICAVTDGGHLSCWAPSRNAQPQQVRHADGTPLADVVSVAVGDRALCVVHGDGGVSCWGGRNDAGQLGDGTRSPRPAPARLAGLTGVTAVAMSDEPPQPDADGEHHTCAVHTDGSLSCWGGNGFGQLGDGTRSPRPAPAPVQRPGDGDAEDVPVSPTPLLRVWVDRVVEALEEENPWLRAAWDHIRERSSVVENAGFAGAVFSNCGVLGGEYTCESLEMRIQRDSMDIEVVVHELAHVYDFTTGLAPARPWGAVQLYFTTMFEGCEAEPWGDGVELLADAMRYLILPGDGKTYLDHKAPNCPTLPAKLSTEAWEVLRAGLAGEVPAWYTENFTDGEALWSQFLIGRPPTALANFANEFGGFCSLDWAGFPLDPARLPPAGSDPFRDGGC